LKSKNYSKNDLELKGKLIVVDGIDGSGKSTQIRLLGKWLSSKLLPVFMTEWNSSGMVKEITSKGKKKGRLTPTTFSLLHATDFADRYERNIFPLLRAGYIVLADRYVYTAYARDIVRGCSQKWIHKVYDFAIKPDAAFYFRVPVDIAIERILVGRPKLKYYEAGMDLNLSNDPYDIYRTFQRESTEQYEAMNKSEGLTVIDETSGVRRKAVSKRRSLVIKVLKFDQTK
jgi:dTMP kinase